MPKSRHQVGDRVMTVGNSPLGPRKGTVRAVIDVTDSVHSKQGDLPEYSVKEDFGEQLVYRQSELAPIAED